MGIWVLKSKAPLVKSPRNANPVLAESKRLIAKELPGGIPWRYSRNRKRG
jgi:hypothetical protein